MASHIGLCSSTEPLQGVQDEWTRITEHPLWNGIEPTLRMELAEGMVPTGFSGYNHPIAPMNYGYIHGGDKRPWKHQSVLSQWSQPSPPITPPGSDGAAILGPFEAIHPLSYSYSDKLPITPLLGYQHRTVYRRTPDDSVAAAPIPPSFLCSGSFFHPFQPGAMEDGPLPGAPIADIPALKDCASYARELSLDDNTLRNNQSTTATAFPARASEAATSSPTLQRTSEVEPYYLVRYQCRLESFGT